ncbi:MAG TPA: methyltransferase domain-containing protein [Planctomycetota bacterium]|nr:methyltransferase domain-containing protein [Planctomycetota bacterium]
MPPPPRPRPSSDNRHGVPFPGRKLPREQWTRTRASLGAARQAFDWLAAFGRDGPRVLDLGCGNGRFLIASALARPEALHLGVELVPQAVKFGSLRAGQRGLLNCKLAWGDATEFLLERCEPGTIDEIHLYHPRPPEAGRRAGRRQLGPEVLLGAWRALRPGGLFVFQTDNGRQARYARRTAPLLFEWRERDGPWPDAPRGRTLREIVAIARRLPITRAEGRRLDLAPEEAETRAASMPEP